MKAQRPMSDLEPLLVDVKESLERQIGEFAREMRDGFAGINSRFDNQAARRAG